MTVTPDNLKIIATIISIVASILLAFRVKGILSALGFVAKCHEHNITQLIPGHQGDIHILGNSDAHVARAQKLWLLIIGFVLYAIAGVLNLWALLIS